MSLKACVIGWPIEHSRSPLIHGHWLETYGIDGSYSKVAVEPDQLETFLSGLEANGYAGCNVTVPHKEGALAQAAVADASARTIGAANTLWLEDGKLMASNTDAYGFLANLDEHVSGWDQSAGTALVLGAGGAARAILHGLLSRGIEKIILTNRTRARAETLAKYFGPAIEIVDWEERESQLADCGLVVNTTSLGMTGSLPLEFDLVSANDNCIVNDLVYAPLETGLLANARERGLACVDGLGMLLHQAVPGFEKWFGVRPEVTGELRELIVANLRGE